MGNFLLRYAAPWSSSLPDLLPAAQGLQVHHLRAWVRPASGSDRGLEITVRIPSACNCFTISTPRGNLCRRWCSRWLSCRQPNLRLIDIRLSLRHAVQILLVGFMTQTDLRKSRRYPSPRCAPVCRSYRWPCLGRPNWRPDGIDPLHWHLLGRLRSNCRTAFGVLGINPVLAGQAPDIYAPPQCYG